MTKEDVLNVANAQGYNNEFHSDGCYIQVGPRGKLTGHCEIYRITGQFQPRPRTGDWYLPIKYGMYRSARITEQTMHDYHPGSWCSMAYGWYDSEQLVIVAMPEDMHSLDQGWTHKAQFNPRKYRLAQIRQGKVELTGQEFTNWQDAFDGVKASVRLLG